tara:strand:- start:3125 stop:3454 length:330 start_codon:yes stop_codon:yes gene_type:complete
MVEVILNPYILNPVNITLKNPGNGKVCEAGKSISDLKSSVNFSREGFGPYESDQLTYTLYFDKIDSKQSPSSELINISEKTVDVALDEETLDYWRVKTSDGINSNLSLV